MSQKIITTSKWKLQQVHDSKLTVNEFCFQPQAVFVLSRIFTLPLMRCQPLTRCFYIMWGQIVPLIMPNHPIFFSKLSEIAYFETEVGLHCRTRAPHMVTCFSYLTNCTGQLNFFPRCVFYVWQKLYSKLFKLFANWYTQLIHICNVWPKTDFVNLRICSCWKGHRIICILSWCRMCLINMFTQKCFVRPQKLVDFLR